MILQYCVRCQTRFVQVPLLIMEAGARSVWCGSFRYVGIVSKHQFCHGTKLSLYVPGFLAKRLISTQALAETRAELQISRGALDPGCQSREKERLNGQDPMLEM